MDDLIKVYDKFSEYLSVTNILVWLWRKFAWACIRGVKGIVDAFESL
ncbi:hypothetical protein [Enterococcus rivorum]